MLEHHLEPADGRYNMAQVVLSLRKVKDVLDAIHGLKGIWVSVTLNKDRQCY
jgi:hypothetical protein